MTPSPSRRAPSLLLGALLTLPPTTASAHPFPSASLAPTTRERSQLLLAEGDAAYANEHLEEAISKYRASYYGLSPDDQASYLGSLPVRKAMRTYEQLIANQQDPAKQRALLQRQRLLLIEFLDAVADKYGAADEVGEDVIAELEQKRRSIDDALTEPQTDDTEVPAPSVPPADQRTSEALPGPDDGKDTSSPPPPKPPRDWLGLGLVIGGTTTLAAGAGVSIGYFSIRSGADALVAAGSSNPAHDPDSIQTYLDQEYARARIFLITGAAAAGVGLAVVIGGAVHLALHRRRPHTPSDATASTLAPIASPTTAGLVFRHRF
ncbi:hypothetical protein [Paraliomyxa miuraensis]|uniref:hypothetical protein n=1 Tax=Paraliomyxa miuraensis TaxID=376150 RepID=UPI00224FE3A8|nr:hypothetical protein [Paraliomyxa miuraensis]MCX4241742.1 hypothetical protein [Paraliomyxa miuraensis]